MIHYFVLFLILTAASSIGAFSLLQMNQSTQGLIKAQSERQNLDMWEYSLINKLEPLGSNQGLAAPMGVNDSTDANADGNPDIPHQILPDGFGMKKRNAWGRYFVYCPHYPEPIDFSVDTSPVWTGTSEGDSSNYLTGVVTDHAGVDYVVQADPSLDASLSGRKVLAMVISPLPSSLTPPSCGSVTYDSSLNDYRVPNGIVRVIEQSNAVMYQSGGRSVTVVDSDDFATQNLNTMLDQVGANNPDVIMLDLSANASSYTFSSNFAFTDPTPGNNRSVIIEGDGKGNTIIGAGGPIDLTFDGVDVLIKNVTLTDNVRLTVSNGRIITDNAELSQSTFIDSTWVIKNNVEIIDTSATGQLLTIERTTVSQRNAGITLKGGPSKNTLAWLSESQWGISGGYLTMESAVAQTTAMHAIDKSSIVIKNSSVNFQRNNGAQFKTDSIFKVGQGSSIALRNSTFLNSYPAVIAFSVSGEIVFDASNFESNASIDNAIVAVGGGVITIDNNSVIGLGTAPVAAVVDAGMRFAIGVNSTLYATTSCWSGPLFLDLNKQLEGTSESTRNPSEIFNQSIWTCNP